MKFNIWKVLPLLPLVIDAAKSIGVAVDHATDPASDGGKAVTGDESIELADQFHAALRPFAVAVVRTFVK